MPDVHMRLVHYKRIANCRASSELDALKIELIDRFGLLPPPLKTLFSITALKLLAPQLGIAKIQAGAEGGSITFAERSRVDPVALAEAHRKRSRSAIGSTGLTSCGSRGRSRTPTSASPRSRSCCAAWAPRTRRPPRPDAAGTLYCAP